MAEVINGILINETETKNIMTKSSLPVGGYSVNPYVGCTHACKYAFNNLCRKGKNFMKLRSSKAACCLGAALVVDRKSVV